MTKHPAITTRLQNAIEMAISHHPGLTKKAFVQSISGEWGLSPNVLYSYYSSTEAMIVGPIVELFFEVYGSAVVTVRPETLPVGSKPSQLIWHWSPAFFEMTNWLDAEQKDILKELLGS
jgi:hypothetical protein